MLRFHAMDDVSGLLGVLNVFSTTRPLARCLVASESFLPKVCMCLSSRLLRRIVQRCAAAASLTSVMLSTSQAPRNGRDFARWTVLGSAFSLAILTDRAGAREFSTVRDKYLSNIEGRSQAEINSVVSSLRLTVNQLATTLHGIVLNLLKKVCAVSTFTASAAPLFAIRVAQFQSRLI